MQELHQTLITLQELDSRIADAEAKVRAFDPQLEELEAPAAELDKEIVATQAALDAHRTGARRLERAADEKRERLKRYEERLMKVRDAREEAAARTELDLVRRAMDADEREAIETMDQAKRTELKLDELTGKRDALRKEIEPRREELTRDRASAEAELDELRQERAGRTQEIAEPARILYERVRGGRTRSVLAALTVDGACGHCFSMVPIQRQAEIRTGATLVRCEECGVILYAE